MTSEERAPEDAPELVRAFAAAERERAFWQTATVSLTRRFPERFVAVVDTGADAPEGLHKIPLAEVVGTAVDLAGVEVLRRRALASGVPPTRFWVRFVTASTRRLILPVGSPARGRLQGQTARGQPHGRRLGGNGKRRRADHAFTHQALAIGVQAFAQVSPQLE